MVQRTHCTQLKRCIAPVLLTILTVGPFGCASDDSDDSNEGESSEIDSETDTDQGKDTGEDTGNDDTASEPANDSDSDKTEWQSSAGVLCPREERAGGFTLLLDDGYTSLNGSVLDSVPLNGVYELIEEEGACQLLGPINRFCDPGCTGSQVCSDSGECVDAPLKQNVGTLEFDGLNTELSINPNPIILEYSKKISDPFPAFDAGSAIHISLDGGNYAPFEMDAVGVSQLSSKENSVQVESESPAAVEWDAGDNGDATEIHVQLTVNTHGGTTGWIECVVEDSGSFEIPGSLVTSLINMGLSGYPSLVLTRRTADSVQTDMGCVDFVVASKWSFAVEIPGLVSCSNDDECETGQTCSEDLVCVE